MPGPYRALGALGLGLLAACQPLPPQPGTPASLTLLHSNDTHSHLESFAPPGETEQGGVARRLSLVEQVRAERGAERVLLVDAGDYSQGMVLYHAWGGSESVMAMNRLGYDAVTLGNHEFDRGPHNLARVLCGGPVSIQGVSYPTEALRAPLVASNLDVSGEPALRGLIAPSLTLDKGGQTYGILGVVAESAAALSSPGPALRFLDYVAGVQAEADRLRAQGVNKIILLSHAGYAVDLANAPRLSGVDIIVSGHDHALLGDPRDLREQGLPKQAEQVKGPYPSVARDRDGNLTLIVSAMEWGRWLGRLDVEFDAAGRILEQGWRGRPLFVRGCARDGEARDCRAAVPEDPALRARVAAYQAPLDAYAQAPVGRSAMPFEQRAVRERETELGNLLADLLLAATQDGYRAVAALTNGGGLRADIPQGEVRFGDLLAVLPFQNTAVVVELSGRELLAALDHGFSHARGRSSGAFPQIAGMRVTYCARRPCPGALAQDGVVTALSVAGAPLDLDATYRVASNSYLAGGGDFYDMLANACQAGRFCEDTGLPLLDLLVDACRRAPLAARVEGRSRALE